MLKALKLRSEIFDQFAACLSKPTRSRINSINESKLTMPEELRAWPFAPKIKESVNRLPPICRPR